ncbi:MAG: ParA family protein [Actinomycetota bacterium]|nr:ParA family protein [Actinomycetota bacterium]
MKTVMFYNQKGGVGKTSIAVNFAYLAASEGFRTLLWDLDPQASATFILRGDDDDAPKASKIVSEESSLDELAISSNYNNLFLLASSLKMRLFAEKLAESKNPVKRLTRILEATQDEFDLTVIDAPPNLTGLSETVISAIDLVVVPLQPSPLAVRSSQVMIDHLASIGLSEKCVALYNMVDLRRIGHRVAISETEPIGKLPKLRSFIPYSADIEKMAITREPLPVISHSSKSSLAIQGLYNEISNLIYAR